MEMAASGSGTTSGLAVEWLIGAWCEGLFMLFALLNRMSDDIL